MILIDVSFNMHLQVYVLVEVIDRQREGRTIGMRSIMLRPLL
jgi:hypothetical protein